METVKRANMPGERVYLWRFRGEDIIVPGREIIYLHTEQRKVYVHTISGIYRVGGTMKEAVKKVGDLPMVRTHASYLVHLDYLQRINRHDAVLKNGEKLPVSARCWSRVRPVVEAYIREGGWKNPLT